MKILHCISHGDSVFIISNENYRFQLSWFVKTEAKNKKDFCKGCAFLPRNNRDYIGLRCPYNCCKGGHFKRIHAGDIMVREDGKKFIAQKECLCKMFAIPTE